MSILSNLKRRVFLSKLGKQCKGLARQKEVHNLVTARTVGVLCYAESAADFELAMQFVSFITGKNLQACLVVYVPSKVVPESYLLRKNANIFSIKELNWYQKPIIQFVDEFIAMDYDILVDLSRVETLPLRWIATLSRANFKVGRLNYLGCPSDLTISLKSTDTMEYYISQIKYYLNLINNRFALDSVK